MPALREVIIDDQQVRLLLSSAFPQKKNCSILDEVNECYFLPRTWIGSRWVSYDVILAAHLLGFELTDKPGLNRFYKNSILIKQKVVEIRISRRNVIFQDFNKIEQDILQFINIHFPEQNIDIPNYAVDIQSSIRILNESADIINTTKKIDTYFSRLALYYKQALLLVEVEKASLTNFDPPVYKMIIEHWESRDITIFNKFQLYLNTEIQSISSLKTENARKKRLVKLYDTIEQYKTSMPYKTYEMVLNYLNENQS